MIQMVFEMLLVVAVYQYRQLVIDQRREKSQRDRESQRKE